VGAAVLARAVAVAGAVGSGLGAVGAAVGAVVAGLGRELHAATPTAAPVTSRPLMNFRRFNMAVILS
jgi:hypothetical protein